MNDISNGGEPVTRAKKKEERGRRAYVRRGKKEGKEKEAEVTIKHTKEEERKGKRLKKRRKRVIQL